MNKTTIVIGLLLIFSIGIQAQYIIQKDGKFGLTNKEGNIIIEPYLDSIRINDPQLFEYHYTFTLKDVKVGNFILYKDNKKGYAIKPNDSDWVISDVIYDDIHSDYMNFIKLKLNNKFSYVCFNSDFDLLLKSGNRYWFDIVSVTNLYISDEWYDEIPYGPETVRKGNKYGSFLPDNRYSRITTPIIYDEPPILLGHKYNTKTIDSNGDPLEDFYDENYVSEYDFGLYRYHNKVKGYYYKIKENGKYGIIYISDGLYKNQKGKVKYILKPIYNEHELITFPIESSVYGYRSPSYQALKKCNSLKQYNKQYYTGSISNIIIVSQKGKPYVFLDIDKNKCDTLTTKNGIPVISKGNFRIINNDTIFYSVRLSPITYPIYNERTNLEDSLVAGLLLDVYGGWKPETKYYFIRGQKNGEMKVDRHFDEDNHYYRLFTSERMDYYAVSYNYYYWKNIAYSSIAELQVDYYTLFVIDYQINMSDSTLSVKFVTIDKDKEIYSTIVPMFKGDMDDKNGSILSKYNYQSIWVDNMSSNKNYNQKYCKIGSRGGRVGYINLKKLKYKRSILFHKIISEIKFYF